MFGHGGSPLFGSLAGWRKMSRSLDRPSWRWELATFCVIRELTHIKEVALYHLTYNVIRHPKGILKRAIPQGHGACDRLLICSIIDGKDGGVSYAMLSRDGKTGDKLSPIELFKVWAVLAKALTKKDVPSTIRQLCGSVHEAVKSAVLHSRESQDGDENLGVVQVHARSSVQPHCGATVVFPGAKHPGVIAGVVQMRGDDRWGLLIKYHVEDEDLVRQAPQGGVLMKLDGDAWRWPAGKRAVSCKRNH